MSTKVDFTKPYGEVCGSGESHRYEQDGRRFDSEGNLIAEPKAAKAEAPKAAQPKAAKADDQVDQQLAG